MTAAPGVQPPPKEQGHKKALVLDEGILEWHRRGYPVTAAEGVTAPPKESMHPHP